MNDPLPIALLTNIRISNDKTWSSYSTSTAPTPEEVMVQKPTKKILSASANSHHSTGMNKTFANASPSSSKNFRPISRKSPTLKRPILTPTKKPPSIQPTNSPSVSPSIHPTNTTSFSISTSPPTQIQRPTSLPTKNMTTYYSAKPTFSINNLSLQTGKDRAIANNLPTTLNPQTSVYITLASISTVFAAIGLLVIVRKRKQPSSCTTSSRNIPVEKKSLSSFLDPVDSANDEEVTRDPPKEDNSFGQNESEDENSSSITIPELLAEMSFSISKFCLPEQQGEVIVDNGFSCSSSVVSNVSETQIQFLEHLIDYDDWMPFVDDDHNAATAMTTNNLDNIPNNNDDNDTRILLQHDTNMIDKYLEEGNWDALAEIARNLDEQNKRLVDLDDHEVNALSVDVSKSFHSPNNGSVEDVDESLLFYTPETRENTSNKQGDDTLEEFYTPAPMVDSPYYSTFTNNKVTRGLQLEGCPEGNEAASAINTEIDETSSIRLSFQLSFCLPEEESTTVVGDVDENISETLEEIVDDLVQLTTTSESTHCSGNDEDSSSVISV